MYPNYMQRTIRELRSEMIKAVLFDLDGTLLNRDASVENS